MLGDTVLSLCCSLASLLLFSKRGMDSGSSCQLGSSLGSSIGGGLEGVINGLLMRFVGIFGYQIVYETKKG